MVQDSKEFENGFDKEKDVGSKNNDQVKTNTCVDKDVGVEFRSGAKDGKSRYSNQFDSIS